jgi:hypothetical protein
VKKLTQSRVYHSVHPGKISSFTTLDIKQPDYPFTGVSGDEFGVRGEIEHRIKTRGDIWITPPSFSVTTLAD